MAQHDYIIANQSGAAFRSDLNNGLAAIVSQNSGAAQPSTTYAYQWWADTTTGLLKIRNAANSAWITIGTLASANLGLATVASPTFTGTPAAPTATASTNTTQLATTAFVLGQSSSTTPVMNGTAAVGTGTTFARADHVHASDTSRAPLASPSFTGNLSFNSGYGSSAVAYGCRAWVSLNGTGTVAIRGSGNVSSITDNGTGDYTINFTTAMPDASYAAVVGGIEDNAGVMAGQVLARFYRTTPLIGSIRVSANTDGLAAFDMLYFYLAIFR
jgi:hypothetical protein